MAYVVNITARAERDLAHLYEDINATDSAAARKWYLGLTSKILSLERKPNRCPVTPENPHLRHLLFGRKPHVYRVIYRVIETPKRVEVLHIRHGARRSFTGSG
jgi:toxin ParE1/3/4